VNIFRYCVCYTIGDISYKNFKRGYQPRTNIIKDEKGDLVTESHNIFLLGGENISLSY
jgi:hypothetical protein